jgi:hypothetical protein
MTAGSVLAAASVLAWSQVDTPLRLYAVFVAIGVASALVLYPPAFAVVVAATSPERRTTALIGVTLVAGFASSMSHPTIQRMLVLHASGIRPSLPGSSRHSR